MSGPKRPKIQQAAPVTPAIAPPPTTVSAEVGDVQRRARLGAAMRRGFASRSIKAGETASGTSYQAPAGTARTLGGY